MTSPTPPFLAFTLVSRRNHRWQRRGQLIEWLAPPNEKTLIIYYLG